MSLITSNYKAKRIKTKKVKKEGEFVTKTPFEMHFGFPDNDCDVAEYEGGGLEIYAEPKVKQQLTDY